jgi:hypothetical protein
MSNSLRSSFVVKSMAAQPPIPPSLWNTIPLEAQAALLALIACLECLTLAP